MDRRDFIRYGGLAAGAVIAARVSPAEAQQAQEAAAAAAAAPATPGARQPIVAPGGQPAVVTPNGSTLPLRTVNGVKVGHLIAEPVDHEFAPGLRAECWGYNGSTPGPTIEAVEGDTLRLYVSNRLPEPTTVHWHGIILPNGMDGVAGLTQRPIPRGETYVYEFTVRHPGTYMYHPHYDEMTQIALGMTGMLIVHPRRPRGPRVDRDFVMMTHEFRLNVGARRPDPNEMKDFNVLTFNSKVVPGHRAAGGGARRARAHPPRQPEPHGPPPDPPARAGLPRHRHRRRLHQRVRAAPRHDRAGAGGQHARDRVRARGAGRLGHALPHDPPRHDQMGHGNPPMVGADSRTSTGAWRA
jgi:FtsP/CotA-like multicopper oxidase with cupredoxin domain